MKPKLSISAGLILAVCLLAGCGQSSSTSNETGKSTSTAASSSAPGAAAPAPAASTDSSPAASTPAAVAAADSQPPATTTPVPAAADNGSAQDALAAPASQFATAASAQPDKQAASIGGELAAKAKSLAQSAAGNPDLKSRVGSALQSLSAGKDASALGTLFQEAKQANLTAPQTQLVKDVGNLASAYVVQRNFSSLDGAQGDVATIVSSLRKGSITPAIPALQSLAQNASLTSQQKDLIGTLADQYAPGLKKASDSLKQGLQGLQGLTK